MEEEFLLEIVSEREKIIKREKRRKENIPKSVIDLRKEYPNAELSMVFIDSKEAKRIISIGSRIAYSVTEEITREEIAELINKYAMTVRIIQWEIERRERTFRRRKTI